MNKRVVIVSAFLAIMTLAPTVTVEARGSSGGGRSSFSSSRSSSSSSRSSSSRSTPKPAAKPAPKTTTIAPKPATKTAPKPVAKAPVKPAAKPPVSAQRTSTKPGTSVKTPSGKTVKSSAKKPTNKKFSNEKGIYGANGYTPQFRGGYNPPYGSVVYYQSHSALDYLPWIYLFSQNSSPAPQNQQATVVQPDGKEVKVQPVAEKQGTDGLAILNWIILILLAVGMVALVIYLVNKYTTKKPNNAKAW